MRKKFILLLFISQSFLLITTAQTGVGISAAALTSFTPNPAAILDISSTTLGLLVPQITNLKLPGTLTTAAPGLLFFNTTASVPFLYLNTSSTTSTNWISLPVVTNQLSLSGTNLTSTITSGGTAYASNSQSLASVISTNSTTAWNLNGNSSGASYLGTTNAKDLVLAANQVERMRIVNTTGNVGIGTVAPNSTLEIVGNIGANFTKDVYGTSSLPVVTSSVLYFSKVISPVKTLYIPAASACSNRRYIIANALSSVLTVSQSYNNKAGGTSTTVAGNTSVEIISDGTSWDQIY